MTLDEEAKVTGEIGLAKAKVKVKVTQVKGTAEHQGLAKVWQLNKRSRRLTQQGTGATAQTRPALSMG